MTTKDAKPKRPRSTKTAAASKKTSAAEAAASPEPESAVVARQDEASEATAVAPESAAPDGAVTVGSVPESDPAMLSARSAAIADLTRLVVFRMEGQSYALPIEAVQEIQQMVAVSEMPGSSGAVLGVINLRGHVIPAIDMRTLVGLSFREPSLETPMIVTYTSHGVVALIVDEVEDVVEVQADDVQQPSAVHPLASRLLGVCRFEEGLVFLFDVDAVIPPVTVAGVGRP